MNIQDLQPVKLPKPPTIAQMQAVKRSIPFPPRHEFRIPDTTPQVASNSSEDSKFVVYKNIGSQVATEKKTKQNLDGDIKINAVRRADRVIPMRKRLRLLIQTPIRVAVLLAGVCVIAGLVIAYLSVGAHSNQAQPAEKSLANPDNLPDEMFQSDTGLTRGEVTVQVSGAVKTPGVFKLPADARVNDAIQKAGGLLDGIDQKQLNLARVVADGENIEVLTPAEQAVRAANGHKIDGKVSINTATVAELQQVEGIGPVMAQKIVNWRTSHGQFKNLKQLSEIDGVGEKTLAKLKDKLTL